MNFHKYFKSSALIDTPLCGITVSGDTYKDELILATGDCTRYVRRRIFDGTENWTVSSAGTENEYYAISGTAAIQGNGFSSHYIYRNITTSNTVEGMFVISNGGVRVRDKSFSSVSDFKSFLSQQYAAGTPVTVWYVLAEPTTETITVPSGLSGTIEGTMSQSGTPTTTNPIYPIANNAVGWYDINNYVRDTTWQARGSIYKRSGGSWSSSAKKRSRLKKK